MGEILEGNELVNSRIRVGFKQDRPRTKLCEQTLSDKDADTLAMAVRNHYWYQFYLDDLPMWGMVGEMSKPGAESQATAAPLIFTHKKFSIAYNGKIGRAHV